MPITVRLGDATGGPALELAPCSEGPVAAEPGSIVSIGRNEANDIVVADDLLASRFHARLRAYGDGRFEIVDLGSSNGTFVNGTRLRRAVLEDGDVVTIGAHAFQFAAGELQPIEEETASFAAVDLSVYVDGGRKILDDVSLFLEPSSVLAVVGPSGAGKTTLLNALTGFRPADEGSVTFGGRDLYDAYDELRFRMGYVPQEDILHTQLTVRRALEYAAALRFPPDVSREERTRRIDEVLAELGLSERSELRIGKLSGGQRKRVSVALELLTKPAFLFLDEPTSGLDPGNERELMELVRELARGGRIVIVVTHSVQSLDLCDRIVFLAPGGKTAYFGPPSAMLEYFDDEAHVKSYAGLFTLLDRSREIDWKARYLESSFCETYVERPEAEHERRRRIPHKPAAPRRGQPWLGQLWVLSRRNVSVMLGDWKAVLLLSLQAPVLGLLYLLLFKDSSLLTRSGPDATLLVWLLAIGATWLGTSNAIREIVKELPIYRRERSVGLSIGPYLGSKVLVLGTITVVQCVVLVAFTLSAQDRPRDDAGIMAVCDAPRFVAACGSRFEGFGDAAALGSHWWIEIAIGVAIAGLAAMSLGLLVSALVRTSDQALVLLPVILAVQVVLSIPDIDNDAVKKLGNVSSAEWGTAAVGSTVGLNELRLAQNVITRLGAQELRFVTGRYRGTPLAQAAAMQRDRLLNLEQAIETRRGRWAHDAGTWWTDIAILLAFAGAALAGAWLALRARDLELLSGERPVRAGPRLRPAAAAEPRPAA